MFLHELPDAKDLFLVVSEEKGINPSIVEKDYWVMHALWGLKQQHNFELKGGTSLSKAYNIIERFSEDIDVQVHPQPEQQVKRAVKSLARAGLIEIQSTDKNLILKCPLAALDKTTQNKADLRPTHQTDTRQTQISMDEASDSSTHRPKGGSTPNVQADPPQKSEFNYVCVLRNFEKFWQTYPHATAKKAAFEAFKKLNPDRKLFRKMLAALEQQVTDYKTRLDTGHWVAQWKYPANWLRQESWKDELLRPVKPTHRPLYVRREPESLWNSCEDVNYEFDED